MAGQTKKSGHKPNLAKKSTRKAYNNGLRRYRNKLKRVTQSCGSEYAQTWMKNRPCHAVRYTRRHRQSGLE